MARGASGYLCVSGRMNIAFLRKKYSFHGGAEKYLHGLATHMARNGHQVHVYAAAWDAADPDGLIQVHRVPCWTFNSFVRDLSFALGAKRALRGASHDIVQSHAKTFAQDVYRAGDGCHVEWLRQRWRRAGWLTRLRTVINPHNWLNVWLERRILRGRRYVRVMAISEFVKRNLMDAYGVPAADIDVVYNGVDVEAFHPRNRASKGAEVRARHGIGQDERVALFVGSGFERKGVQPLLQAVARVRGPLTVLVVGRGKAVVPADMPGDKRIVFCGPQPDVTGYYAAADVFVFPTMYEPFGNVHLEALASGVPVVTTRLGGGAELVEEGVSGCVVDAPEDVDGIARGVELLLAPAGREAKRAAARAVGERYSFERHIRDATAVYERVLAQKAAVGAR